MFDVVEEAVLVEVQSTVMFALNMLCYAITNLILNINLLLFLIHLFHLGPSIPNPRYFSTLQWPLQSVLIKILNQSPQAMITNLFLVWL